MPPGVVHGSRDFWYSEEASALVDVVGGGLRRRRRAATVRHTLQLPLGIILNPAAGVQNTHPVIQRSRPYVAIQVPVVLPKLGGNSFPLCFYLLGLVASRALDPTSCCVFVILKEV